jgi:hypothetical protein
MLAIGLTIISLGITLGFLFILTKFSVKVNTEPFALPKGTIRSLITLLLISPIPVILIYSAVLGKEIKIPEAFWGVIGSIIGFYFGFRTKS